jgi:hypothetical protein
LVPCVILWLVLDNCGGSCVFGWLVKTML